MGFKRRQSPPALKAKQEEPGFQSQLDTIDQAFDALSSLRRSLTDNFQEPALTGMHRQRLSANTQEMRYADAWRKLNADSRNTLLADILSTGNIPTGLTARDWVVASTLIQWLGSPVGQDFVDSVRDYCPHANMHDTDPPYCSDCGDHFPGMGITSEVPGGR